MLLAEHAFQGGAGGSQADQTSAIGSSFSAAHSLLPLGVTADLGGLDFDFLAGGGDDHWAGTSFLQESRRSEAEELGGSSSSLVGQEGAWQQSAVHGAGTDSNGSTSYSVAASVSMLASDSLGDAEHPAHGLPSPREQIQAAKRKRQRVDIICDPVTTLRLDQLRCTAWEKLDIQLGGMGQDLTRAPEQHLRQQVYHMMNQPLSNRTSIHYKVCFA